MRPGATATELFAAFSRLGARAFTDDRLLACPTLSKAPDCGQVLRRYTLREAHLRPGPGLLAKIAARYAASNILHLLFLVTSALFARLLRWPLPKTLGANSDGRKIRPLLIIDSFAVLPRIAEEGAYRELYLPGLAAAARRAGHDVVALHRFYGSRNPLVLWRAMKALAAKGQGLAEVHLFRPADWLSLVRHMVAYPFSLYRLIHSLRDAPGQSAEAYIRDALIESAGQCALVGEARRIAAYRLHRLLADGAMRQGAAAHIVSWYENQTVNKCFQRGLAQAEAADATHIPVTGAQLFIWPDTLLNNHPDDAEAALGLAPDKVLVNGPYFLPDESVQHYAVGPSLRYAALFSAEAAACPDREHSGRTPLLALLSYHPEEIRRVLSLVLPLAEGGEEIVYRFHPATRPQDFASLLPARPSYSHGGLSEALRSCRAVIGSGSGSLAEAAAVGVSVLAVEDAVPGLGLEYLPDFGKGKIWESVREREDIIPALDKLRAFAASPQRQELLRDFRALLFTEPTEERIVAAFGL